MKDYFKCYKEYIGYNGENIIVQSEYRDKAINKDVTIRKMYRMTTKDKVNVNIDNDIVFNENLKKCAIENNNSIISYAKVSDIYCNLCNIVIYTDDKYRNNDYATKLLSFITNYILDNNLLPIMLIDVNNTSSIKCALKCNYKIMNEEIIVTENQEIVFTIFFNYYKKCDVLILRHKECN